MRRLRSSVLTLVVMSHSPSWTIVAVPAPGQHLGEVARLADIEHDDRNIVVAAKRDRRRVHDLEIVAQDAC